MRKDQEYIKSMELWFRMIGLSIRESEEEIFNAEKQKNFIDQRIKLSAEKMAYDKVRLEKARIEFDEYLKAE